jgi:hypothetical protein
MPHVDTILITPRLLALLSALDEFKGAWRALGTLAPDRLRALQLQKRRLAEKVERERAEVALSDLAMKILDYARAHGRVTTRDMVLEHSASPNTLKFTSGGLVEKGLLARHGGVARPGMRCRRSAPDNARR